MDDTAIMLDKERHLKLTLGGMKAFEKETGKNLLKGFDLERMDITEITVFIWSCLIWEDKNLTLEELGFLVDFDKLTEISSKLSAKLSKTGQESSPNSLSLSTG